MYLCFLKLQCFYSEALDFKTSWGSQSWCCKELKHYEQKDGYNCGVLICMVSVKFILVSWYVNVNSEYNGCR